MSSDAYRKLVQQVREGFAAIRAAFDPSMMAQLEEMSAQMAPLEAVVKQAELESRKEHKQLARAFASERRHLEDLVGANIPSVSPSDVLEAMRNGVTPTEFAAYAVARRDRSVTVNNFFTSGGGGGGTAATSTTAGRGGGGPSFRSGGTRGVGSFGTPRAHPTRVSQAEFVQVASQGDLTQYVLLQGDDGPGDLVRLAGYTVQPDPATEYLVLTHCEATPPGATWKDSKRPFPPKGRPYWVRDVTLGAELPDGTRPVVIHVSHGDRVDTGEGKQPAQRAADRLRFIPEEDVLEMAIKFEQRGSINGVPWVLNDSVRAELPLLYIANGGEKQPVNWADLYARLLLGEEA